MGRRPIAFDPTFKNRGRGKKRGTVSVVEPLQNLTGSLTFYNAPEVGEGEYLIVSDSHTAKEIAEGSATPIFWVVDDDNIVEIVNGLPNNVTIVHTKAEALSYLAVQGYSVISSETSNVVTDGLILDLNAKHDLSFIDEKPTTNFYTDGHFPDGQDMAAEGGSNAKNEIVFFPNNPGNSNFVLKQTKVGNTTEYELTSTGLSSSTTYCLSGWYAESSDYSGNSRMFHCRAYSSGGSHVALGTGIGTVLKTKVIDGITWKYCYATITTPSDATGTFSWYVGYENSSYSGARYYTNLQLEEGDYPTPYSVGAREQNIIWKDMSGGPSGIETWYTLYALTYPESSQTPASRDGITPGYNVTSGTKTYDLSRDLNYFVFDEDTNTWVADSYFNGERIDGHCYDTYDGQPSQHQKFQDDFDDISGSFPNATHIIIGSHAAENNDNDSDTLERLQRLGLPNSHIGVTRPEYILVGKIGKPYTHRYIRENVNSGVAKMNLSLPLEGKSNVNLYNGTSFNSNGWLEFDGSNDRAYSVNDYTYGNETTWVATVRRDSNNNNYNMFMGDYLPYFGFRSSQNYKFHFSNQIAGSQRNLYGTTQTSLDTWYHVAFTTEYNGSSTTMRIFVNGVEENNGTWSGVQTQQSGQSKKFTIGDGRSSATWYPLDGAVSNVQIYNKKLTSAEISQNYYNGPIVTDNLVLSVDAGNLVSYENGSTTTYDMVKGDESDGYGSYDSNGTLTNGVLFDENSGGAWDFDGSNDYISFGTQAFQYQHDDAFSLEVWINPEAVSGFKHLIGVTYASYRLAHSGTSLSFRLDANNLIAAGGTLETGKWTHVIATYNPTTKTAKVYQNGVQVASSTNSTADWTSQGTDFRLASSPGENYYFNGKIAIGRVYKKTLSSSEVGQNFEAQKSRFSL